MCGIGGIINTSNNRFDKLAFNVIGGFNDTRGGDSCGIFIDKSVYKGTDSNKRFINFTKTISYPKRASISLLHCRKTSPGLVTNQFQCQPIIIKENDEIVFVLMHNGSIKNINSLATKYTPDIITTGLSDSQILAEIIYRTGFDVLSEYHGSASLCIIDYREDNPRVYFWSGYSVYNSNAEDYPVERQLYYIVEKNRFIFSSVSTPLELIDSKATLTKFPTNKLLELCNNQLIEVTSYDRSKLTYTYSNTVYSEGYYNYNLDNSNYYDYYEDDVYVPNKPKSKIQVDNHYANYDSSLNIYYRGTPDTPLHGIYRIYESGYISEQSASNADTFAFYKGMLLAKSEYFTALVKGRELFKSDLAFKDICEVVFNYCTYHLDPTIYVNESLEFVIFLESDVYYSFFPVKKYTNYGIYVTKCSWKSALDDICRVNRSKLKTSDEIFEIIKHKATEYNGE